YHGNPLQKTFALLQWQNIFYDLGYEVKCCAPTFNSNIIYSVKVPEIDFNNVDQNDIVSFVEWLGMISINGDLEHQMENYTSTYETPFPNRILGQVTHLQWIGLFSATKIGTFITELTKYIKLMKKPWVAVYVQGFSDTPVAWAGEEHHYYTNGDNGYLLIFNEEHSLFCTQKCSNKRYK
ncbi:hypothetical protein NQ317_000590, partial [Molorchus minor]